MSAQPNDTALQPDTLEARLQELETCYDVIAGHAPDWDYWLGTDGRYNYVSPACEATCGYPAEAFLGDPELFCRILHPDDHALWHAHLESDAAQGAHDNLLLRVIDRAGEVQWIEHQCLPVMNRQGDYLGRRGINRNVSARIRAEAEARHVSRLLKTLSEVNHAMTRLSSETDFIEAVCRIAVETGGLKACMVALSGELTEELMVYGYAGPGEQWPDSCLPSLDGDHVVMPNGDRQVMGMPLDSDLAGESQESSAHCAWLRAHGIGALIHFPLQRNGVTVGLMSCFADAPEFLRADVGALLSELATDLAYALDSFRHRRLEFEARWKLAEREVYLNALLRNVPIGIGVVVTRVFTDVNSRICEMLGYSAEELLGESVRVLYPDDAEFERVGREQYAEMSATGKGRIDTRWLRKDGRVLPVHLINSPLDPDDPSKGVVFTVESLDGQ